MELFVPNICTITPVEPVAESVRANLSYDNINVPSGSEFQKVFFEELARKCYNEEGSFDSISSIARIHYEEYYGGGSRSIKRWKIFFSKYNILVNIEDNNGIIQIKAA